MESIVSWTLLVAGSIVAGWWLAVRPTTTPRELATPVSALILVLAVLLCLLAVTGTSATGFSRGVYHLLMS